MTKKTALFFIIAAVSTAFLYARPKSDYELVSDNLKLTVFRKTGKFCLYSLSARGKSRYIPLYDDRSLGRDNKFYVLYNGKSYELKKRLGKPVKIEQTDSAIHITYHFTDKFYVVQKLSFTAQSYGTSGPLLKIETVVENTGGDRADMALKAVFDTYLGENRRIPLYTDLRTGIFKETVLEPKFEKDSAVISANSDAACMFLINHSEASVPENVYIANWDRLQSVKWIPSIVQGRSFSTKYFHNDSALLFVWPQERFENNEKLSVTMFIGYFDYIKRHSANKREQEEAPLPVSEPEKISDQDKKDYDYIKALLDKIGEVEISPDAVSDDYIEDLTKQADNAINDIRE